MARRFIGGSSTYMETLRAPVAAAPLTISVWFRLMQATGATAVSLCDTASETDWFRLAIGSNGSVTAATRTAGAEFSATSTGTVALFTWGHAAGVWGVGGSGRSAYLNGGNKVTDGTTIVPDGLNSIALGRRNKATPDTYYTGVLAHIAIWKLDLSDAEIRLLGSGAAPYTVRQNALVLYDALDGYSRWPQEKLFDFVNYNTTLTAGPSVGERRHPSSVMLAAGAPAARRLFVIT